MRFRTVLVLLFMVPLPGCGGAKDDTASRETPAIRFEKLPLEGVPNAVRVGDLLFGGQPTPAALLDLSRQGYKTVLSTRGVDEISWDEKALVESLGMRFASIPMPYPIEAITDAEVSAFADLMKTAPRPMVVHCGSGNRIAGLWAVWLAEREGVAPAQALDYGAQAGMTRIRPVVEKRIGAGS